MLGEKYITDNMYMFVKLLMLSASDHDKHSNGLDRKCIPTLWHYVLLLQTFPVGPFPNMQGVNSDQ